MAIEINLSELSQLIPALLNLLEDLDFVINQTSTLLKESVVAGNTELTLLLLQMGATPNDAAFVKAVVLKQTIVVKKMVIEGANVDAKDPIGWSVLMHATHKQNFEVFKLLLDQKVDVNATNQYGWTALMWAVYLGNKDLA